MDLNEIRVFVKVAQAGSFSQAANSLGMPNSTVSAKVSALERRLGVTLLTRTTRKLKLTEAGDAYFRSSLRGLEEIGRAEDELSATRVAPQGRLRVTVPADLGNSCLMGLVTEYARAAPGVALELIYTNQLIDLVADGVDAAIRAGALPNSGLIAKRIGLAEWVAYASPAYLKRAGAPRHPRELKQHACLQFTAMGTESWALLRGKSEVIAPIEPRLIANEMTLLRDLALAGRGIALLPTFLCHADERAGRLARVLPEWRASSDPIQLVYPRQAFVTPKLRAFVEVATREFGRISAGD